MLLSLLAQESNTSEIRSAFEAVGASRPVELSGDQRTTLKALLGDWLMDDDLFPEGTREDSPISTSPSTWGWTVATP